MVERRTRQRGGDAGNQRERLGDLIAQKRALEAKAEG
jgi:hypothetical protein